MREYFSKNGENMRKHKYHSDWDEFAQLDPKWAILTEPSKKYNKWNDKEFFETGEREIRNFLTKIESLDIEIKFGQALDFGCGIGRLTRALAKHFDKVYGIDISEKMISNAKKLHKENKKMVFLQNTQNDLSCFKSNKFDLIYSVFTLQHISERNVIKDYITEFLKILKPGGLLYFQLPTVADRTWLKSILLRVRGYIYYLFVNIGFSKEYCFSHLRLEPYMHMNYIPSNEIKTVFSGGATIFGVYNDKNVETTYLVQKNAVRLTADTREIKVSPNCLGQLLLSAER